MAVSVPPYQGIVIREEGVVVVSEPQYQGKGIREEGVVAVELKKR